MTTFILCSTSTTVRPAASSRIRRIVASVSSGLMPAVGSSSSSKVGLDASAMPSSRWRFSPWERCAASRSVLAPRPTDLQDRFSALAHLGEAIGARPEIEGPRVALHGDAHVLEHAQVRKDVRDLVRLGDAQPCRRVLRHSGDVRALEPDAAGGRHGLAGDQAEEGGLAGAVGSDDRAQLAAAHAHVDVRHRQEAAIRPRQTLGAQQDGVGHSAR